MLRTLSNPNGERTNHCSQSIWQTALLWTVRQWEWMRLEATASCIKHEKQTQAACNLVPVLLKSYTEWVFEAAGGVVESHQGLVAISLQILRVRGMAVKAAYWQVCCCQFLAKLRWGEDPEPRTEVALSMAGTTETLASLVGCGGGGYCEPSPSLWHAGQKRSKTADAPLW